MISWNLALIAVYAVPFTVAGAASKSLDPPKNAAEHKVGPAYTQAPQPELNPWAGKGIPSKNVFGAHYTHRDYHDGWNSTFGMSGHPDVVVSFDKQPGRYVFWHGVGYIPMLVSENGRWCSNECVRRGVVRRANGVNALVIWIEMNCREETTFEIGM
jgi:hypothetical protein